MSDLPVSERAAVVRLTAEDVDDLLSGIVGDDVREKLEGAREKLSGPHLHRRVEGIPREALADAELDQLHAEALEMLRSAIRGERHFMVAVVKADGETGFIAGGSPSAISPFAFLAAVESCARTMREGMELEAEDDDEGPEA